MGLEVEERRSLIKRRNRVGDRTEPWGTPLVTGKELDVAPSTTTEIVREGVKPKGRSLANRALCQTLSKALEISRATT